MPAEPTAQPCLTAATLVAGARGAYSGRFHDSYHGPAGPLAQARQVFVAQAGLPQAWQQREVFTVLETGFGFGFNFLATWQAWQDDPQRCPRLHFVSIENHPVRLADLASHHAREPGLAALAAALRQQWPPPLAGCHRLSFAGGRVQLTLVHGDGAAALNELDLQADAIFMDGFAPDRNPQLWSPAVCAELARLARPGARLASWCTAGAVRRALQAHGFAVKRQPGIAGKFHMLQGAREGMATTTTPDTSARSVTIIGAGLAGSTLANLLLQRGWQVQLIDAAQGPGQATSGNPAGVVRPLWSLDDNPVTRLTRAAFLHAVRQWAPGQHAGPGRPGAPLPGWHPDGVLQLAQDEQQAAQWAASVPTQHWPGDYVQWLDGPAVTRRSGLAHTHGGLLFALGGWAEPARLCAQALLPGPGWRGTLNCQWGRVVERIEAAPEGAGWRVLGADGACLASTPHVVMCVGAGLAGPAPALASALQPCASSGSAPDITDGLPAQPAGSARAAGGAFLPDSARPLQALRGEITQFSGGQLASVDLVLCGEGYLSPLPDGSVSVGATYDRSGTAQPSAAGIAENRSRLDRLAGPLADGSTTCSGRVGWRSIAADRLPVVGADPVLTGLWHLRALASRGVVWSALMAEVLACSMHGEPLPLLRSELQRISPARVVLRARQRGQRAPG